MIFLGGLLGLGWLGLRRNPRGFPPPAGTPGDLGTVAVPDELPRPVARYLRAALGDPAPLLASAVVLGKGRMRLLGLWAPVRFRFTLLAGQAYRHEIDIVWWGWPVLRADERFQGGQATMRLPFGTVRDSPQVDSAANLALWGESVWFPSAFAADQHLQWQPGEDDAAVLVVPSPEGTDRLRFNFDRETGLVASVEALRYRGPRDRAKTPWCVQVSDWERFQGVLAPSRLAIRWLDQRGPWLLLDVETIVYNLDVSSLLGRGET